MSSTIAFREIIEFFGVGKSIEIKPKNKTIAERISATAIFSCTLTVLLPV